MPQHYDESDDDMLAKLNKIKNADFSEGARKPKLWKWTASSDRATWQPVPKSSNGALRGVKLECSDTSEGGFWSQEFRCKEDQFYRVEAVVSCDCKATDDEGGLVLQLVPFDRSGEALEPFAFETLVQAHEFTLRGYFEAEEPMASVELQIGLRNAKGAASIHDVRVIPVIEPETRSHPAALPPPPFAHQPPSMVRSVSIITENTDRPLVELLRRRLGKNRVTTHGPSRVAAQALQTDAVFLLDKKPPSKVASMKALDALAKDRIVFISPECLAAISDGHVLTKTLKQIDDPFHARVMHSNFVTAGFALYDQIPFAGRGDHSSEMFQRQFRQNRVFNEFCKDHALEVLLDSVTDSEATSEKPIALYKRTKNGAIIVMDVDPVEAVESSLREATPGMNVILSGLGVRQQTVGQFIAGGRSQEEFHSHLCDLVERYPALSWPGERRPVDHEQPTIISVGRDREAIGLPVVERPAIMLRSILNGTDVDAAYGVLLWIKAMLRPAPFVSPYANTLNRRFRLAWLPHGVPIQRWGGWVPQDDVERHDIEAEFEPNTLAAWIDVTTAPSREVRVVVHNSKSIMDRLTPLANMMDQLIGGRHFYQAGADRRRVDDIQWHTDLLKVQVVSSKAGFDDPIHKSAMASKAGLIRVEVPGGHSAPFADSIWKTDWTALLLEQIAGLMMGMIVPNRDATPLKFDWPAKLNHLRKSCVMRKFNEPDVDLAMPKSSGKSVNIPAGHAIIAVD